MVIRAKWRKKISGENTVAYRINPRPKDPLNKDEVSVLCQG